LHIKTTIAVSAVMVAVFAVVIYLSYSATTRLTIGQQQQETQLVAARIEATVEHHIRRKQKAAKRGAEKTDEIDWVEVEEAITDTVLNNYPRSQARVFQFEEPDKWKEIIRIPETIGPASVEDEKFAKRILDSPVLDYVREGKETRLIAATAPVQVTVDNKTLRQIGAVFVLLAFDERTNYASELRRLEWPLVAIAIAAITLITYFLFRHLVYNPLDNLLAAMSRAEAGNLSVEVIPSAEDEIGLLTSQFNRMLNRIRVVTDELSMERHLLQDRVRDATAEIAERNEQLEEINLSLFEMQRQLTQLERLAAAGQLAAQFAHEVGTPLNLISGHVQLLRAGATDERSIKRLDVIASQIERITVIVRSMLDSTRRPEPQLETTDINSLLAQILDAAHPTLASRDVELQIDLCKDAPVVEADSDQLHQVMINLINNCLDAMPEGGLLTVATACQNGSVIIRISDSGQGIPESEISRIFDPLFSTKGQRGTGLGLTIVKQIIVEHGGKVEVESEPGRGTT
ncbi:MAG TPA: ATP-binding protein, partial [Blastocatellia bacterium]